MGLFVAADQSVFTDLSVTPLTGSGSVKKFCSGHGRCMPNGLCSDMAIGGGISSGGSSHSSSATDDDTGDEGALVGVIIGLLIFAFCVGGLGYYYGAYGTLPSLGGFGGAPKYNSANYSGVLRSDMEMSMPQPKQQSNVVEPDINPLRGSAY